MLGENHQASSVTYIRIMGSGLENITREPGNPAPLAACRETFATNRMGELPLYIFRDPSLTDYLRVVNCVSRLIMPVGRLGLSRPYIIRGRQG
jgi:hypothetical protein